MFYSIDLLTLRRNGKFAKCWLAANMTPKIFHNKFRRNTIAEIDVTKTCDELIEHVNTTGRNSRRFSLYLSSQLMLGLTRIFFYKVEAHLKDNLKLWMDVIVGQRPRVEDGVQKKKGEKLPDLPEDADEFELPPPEPSASVYPLPHTVENAAMITLKEPEIALHEYEWMMRNADENFGALTAEQMDAWLDPNANFFSSPSSSVRALPKRNSDEIVHTFKIPQSSPHRVSRSAIVDVGQVIIEDSNLDQIPALVVTEEDLNLNGGVQPQAELVPKTPIKHKLSPIVGVGSPSKKQRGPEAEQENENVSNDMTLESLDSSVLRRKFNKKKPRKLIIDIEMQLPFAERPVIPIREKLKTPDKKFIPAEKLLTTPSTGRRWGKSLRVLFDMMLIEPIAAEPFNVGEAVRVPLDVSEQSKEFSTLTSDLIPKSTTSINVSGDKTKTDEDSVQKSLVVQKLPPLVDAEPEFMAAGPSSSHFEAVPEITTEDTQQPAVEEPQQPDVDITRVPKNILQVIGDWVPGIAQPSSSKASTSVPVHSSDSFTASSVDRQSSRSGKNWVKADVLATLEVYWSENKEVTFKDICHPSSCTKKDASQVFVLLLGLQESKKVNLVQNGPYQSIKIKKILTC